MRLAWIARQIFATAYQVAAAVGEDVTYTYRRLGLLVELGWLVKNDIVFREPGVYRATTAGLARVGVRGRPRPIKLGRYRHHLALADLCIELEREFGAEHVRTRADMRPREDEFRVGSRRLPDIAVEHHEAPGILAIELHVSSFQRPAAFESVVRAYVRAGHVAGVRFYVVDEATEREMRKCLRRVTVMPELFDVRRWTPPRLAGMALNGAGREHGVLEPHASATRLGQSRSTAQLSSRDLEILRWIVRLHMVTVAQVSRRWGFCRTNVYARLKVLVDHGLVVHQRPFKNELGTYSATELGARLAEVPGTPPSTGWGTYHHDLQLTDLCIELEREFGAGRVRTEREIRFLNAADREPRYALRCSGGRRHYPDLAVEDYDGERPLAVELERTLKGRRELERILREYVRGRHIAAVRYYATTAEVERGLRRAAERVHAADFFDIRRWVAADDQPPNDSTALPAPT